MTQAPSKSAELTPPQPPLGISHLMLWILGAAVVLGVYRAYAGQSEAPPIMQAVLVVNQLAFSLLAGINIASVIVYARRLVVRDAPLLAQPGHWLLAIAGVSNVAAWVVLGLCAAATQLSAERQTSAMTPAYHWLAYGIGNFVSFALNSTAAVVIHEPLRWRVSFLVAGLFSAVLGFVFTFMYVFSLDPTSAGALYASARWYACLYLAEQLATIVLVGFNLLADRVARRPRDWLHYVGAIAIILPAIASLALMGLLAWASAAMENGSP